MSEISENSENQLVNRFDSAERKNSLNLQKARENIQLFQLKIICEFDNKLKKYFLSLFHDTKVKMNRSSNENSPRNSKIVKKSKDDSRNTAAKQRGPYKKVFEHRNSILTDLLQIKHISTIYNVFIAFLMFLISINIAYNWREHKKLSFGFSAVGEKFDKIHFAMVAWLYNMSLTLLVHPIFKIWSKMWRTSNSSRTPVNTIFITLFTSYTIAIYWISTHICIKHQLPVITSMALMLETIRISMKSYGYVRSNAERVITSQTFTTPSHTQFVYYLFCPSLLYRDEYPRTKSRDWKLVAKHLAEFLTIIYSLSLAYDCFLAKSFRDYGKTEIHLVNILITLLEITSIMAVIMLYGFYCLQHAWMNMFAELLQFGDRVFYKDWWNATSMKEFYRTWNLTVHEWLYEYIFTDFYNYVTRKSVALSALATLVISAVFHEYALAVTLRFCYPALLTIYLGLGFFMMFLRLNKRLGNVMVWFQLILGLSILYTMYAVEYYARINCPIEVAANSSKISYYFTSATFRCNNIIF